MAYKDPEKARAHHRKWTKENLPHVRNANREYKRRRRASLQGLKARPCEDCGVQYPPYVMDFDHVRGEKKFNIGENIMRPLAEVMEEIEKCDVVCANCHRLRTHVRRASQAQP